jgi:hypothetical protein
MDAVLASVDESKSIRGAWRCGDFGFRSREIVPVPSELGEPAGSSSQALVGFGDS